LVDVEQAVGVARKIRGALQRYDRGFRVAIAEKTDAQAVQRNDLLFVGDG
jgi:hypothetical protein